ncbi:MAG: bifunctional 23S rRNA (guanine(2069)-N(7))-methyltransferase RlmK/23S rRNA (guanine(2445)-N(2))-methyltransferase RlmL [Myxococcota bacterium]
MFEIVVTCAAGTEEVLRTELAELGLQPSEGDAGLVRLRASLRDAYRIVLWSRIASRVLLVLKRFSANDPDELYEAVRAISWEEHLGPDETLAVDCVVSRERRGDHTRFLALRTKDAVVDQLRERLGARPNVDRENPDVALRLRWAEEASLSLDLGGPLHRRGYRAAGAPAPLRENLAAALIALSGWTPDQPLVDPMCGSGTFLIEAAWKARDVAPGLGRTELGGWRGHDERAWAALVAEAQERRVAGRSNAMQLWGFDVSADAIQGARGALRRADVQVPLERRDVRDLDAPAANGQLVVNPPYGVRLDARGSKRDADHGEVAVLYGRLGDRLKTHFGGWTAHVLAPVELVPAVGLKPKSRAVVFNGALECRFASFPIRARQGRSDRSWRASADPFANRLRKNRKKLQGWAKGARLEVYRIYDADIPEFNVAVDVVGEHVLVSEYARPKKVDAALADARLQDVMRVVPVVLEVDDRRVHLRVRARQGSGQYEKRGSAGSSIAVREGAHRFHVNLEDYLDIGLFPDQRQLRVEAARAAAGKTFLNLFAYTCSASVYAAAEGAHTTSVDLSNTYIEWGEANFRLNELDPAAHRFLRRDVLAFLRQSRDLWDVVFLNPPSFSRSKAMDGDFVVERDHAALIEDAMERTRDVLFFSTHARRFELDPSIAERFEVRTLKVVPRDFQRSPFQAWAIRHA